MANYDIRPLQLHLLENLKTIDEVFRAHGLRYYMIGGTMLGAVRHKGFIPWDDDVDLAMPRPDYEQLIAHSREWLPEHLEFICAEYDSDYPLPYAKIQDANTTAIEKTYRKLIGGVFVDIFPIDGVPANSILRGLHFQRFRFWRKIIYFMYRDPYRHGRGPRSWVPLMWQHLFTREFVQKKMRKVLMENNFDRSEYISQHSNRKQVGVKKEVYGIPTPILFEDAMLMGVEQPHEYLINKFNEKYMQLPPENKREQHNFHYLNLNQPYRNYEGAK